MDPVTQGVLGGGFATTLSNKKDLKFATFCGIIGGLAPDLDIFIRSTTDTLLFLEYHRHFSHSIFFVPIGGLIISVIIFLLFFKRNKSFKEIYLFSTLGFLSHGLLDSCTSYGTSLFWPLSEQRVALNIISIIDPLFTIPVLILLMLTLIYESKIFLNIGLFLCCLYLTTGFIKNKQVKSIVYLNAEKRGHVISRISLNPTFGNIILWRTVYESDGYYFVDAVYMPLFSKPLTKQGEKVKVIDKDSVFPSIRTESKHRNDIKRFSHFSNDFIYIHPKYKNIIADLRYGTLPHDVYSLWGIKIDSSNQDQHVEYINLRKFKKNQYKTFWNMLNGKLQEYN